MNNESKIKLLIFTPTLRCGGSEKFVSLVCNHINTEKFIVCLVVLNHTDAFYKIENKEIEVIDIKENRVRFSLFKLKKAVSQFRPDIVFSTANHLNIYFAVFRRWFPDAIKFVARESSIVSINSQRATMPRLYNYLVKRYYRRFDMILCQSAYMKQDLVHNYNLPENKTFILHNASEIRSTGRMISPGNNQAGVCKFITVARLSEEKGIERLIHAVGLLSVSFKFYIIGEGGRRGYLQNLINELHLQENIFLMGEKPEPFAGMEDADFFLMGSYYEGFPNALQEAGMLGIPVIAFNAPGGIAEIITEGENGILVDDNDILDFAAAIKRGLSFDFNRDKIIETTQKRFSVNAMLLKLEDLLRSL